MSLRAGETGVLCKGFCLISVDTKAATGVRVCGPAYGYGSLMDRHGGVFAFFSRAAYAQLPKKHKNPLRILGMTHLPVTEEPHSVKQS